MMNFSQETDAQNGVCRHSESHLPVGIGDVTTAVNEQTLFLPRSGSRDPVQSAEAVLARMQNRSVAEQAGRILAIIRAMVLRVQEDPEKPTAIPPVSAHLSEDGSVLLEWIFPDFRIGFNIEPNPADSGWHLVSNKRLGESAVSQPLPKDLARMSETIAMLIEFIVASI